MAQNPYDTDLDRNPANFQPLTPLAFLQRCAEVFPDRTAVIHGAGKTRYREFYARARRPSIRGTPRSSMGRCGAPMRSSTRGRAGLPLPSASAASVAATPYR